VTASVRETAVGFDLGETLFTYADTPLSWVDHYRHALAGVARICGIELTEPRAATGCEWLARHNTRLHPRRDEISAETIFDEILLRWDVDPARHRTAALVAFFDYFQQRLIAYPETIDVLRHLQFRCVSLGALTDVPYGMPEKFVAQDLVRAGIAELLDVVITSVEVGRRKPDPEGFRRLASRLQAAPEFLWYVGNEQKDITGANAAGAIAVLIDRENRRPDWGQRFTITSLNELPALIQMG